MHEPAAWHEYTEHVPVVPAHARAEPVAEDAYPALQAHAVWPGSVDDVMAPPAHVYPGEQSTQAPALMYEPGAQPRAASTTSSNRTARDVAAVDMTRAQNSGVLSVSEVPVATPFFTLYTLAAVESVEKLVGDAQVPSAHH